MIIVTGGSGFIGSVLIAALNEKGNEDILLVDEADDQNKQKNIAPLKYKQQLGIKQFREQLQQGAFDNHPVEVIFHLGAISTTTETSWDRLLEFNIDYTKMLIKWAADHAVRFIYASSAATYGNGELGYKDDHALFNELKPLNLYGQSKLDVDIWARDNGYLDTVVGLRYFNIFGPNEWHKGAMQSVIAKKFPDVRDKGEITLFKSYHPDYKDGEQKRDFFYVLDAVKATLFFLDNKQPTGIFNIGSGQAHSWSEVAVAMFAALNKDPKITYIDMPEDVKNQYQYFTEADLTKLRATGYSRESIPLNKAIADYIKNYLIFGRHVGEKMAYSA